MRQSAMTVLFALLVALAFTAATSAADEPKKAEPKAENKLVGTWKLVSAKHDGKEAKLPEDYTMLKHVTPVHFMWAVHDKDGKVAQSLGGPCILKGDKYEETPEYGIGDALDTLKGKTQSFTWKVEGNKWYHTGKLSSGTSIEEVWERVQKK
jgi:hypothetical protein